MRNQKGMSLVSVVVAAAILSIVSLGVFNLLSTGFRGAAKIAKKDELTSIRQSLRSQLDCKKTLNDPVTLPVACVAGTFYPLKKIDGTLFADAAGVIGSWKLEASCINNEIIVTAQEGGIATNPKIDLFTGTSELCRSYFSSSGTGELHEQVQIKEVLVGSGPDITVANPPPGATSPVGTASIGSFNFVSPGHYISISSQAHLGGRGSGRGANLQLKVAQGATTIWQGDDVLTVNGVVNGQTNSARVASERLIQTTPGATYQISANLLSVDTGASQTAGGAAPWAMIDPPVRLIIRSYKIRPE